MTQWDVDIARVRQELRAGMYRDLDVMLEYAKRDLEAAKNRLAAIHWVAAERASTPLAQEESYRLAELAGQRQRPDPNG